MRQINEAGMRLIKGFEGCSLTAYPDPASPLGRACAHAHVGEGGYKKIPNWQSLSGTPWTIAWGRTENNDGTPIKEGDTCTQEQADAALLFDVQREGSHFVDAWVRVLSDIDDNEYAALSSFVYNAGAGTFHHSAILMLVNERKWFEAANAFLPFDTAQGTELAGLARRRKAERALFLGDIAEMDRILAE